MCQRARGCGDLNENCPCLARVFEHLIFSCQCSLRRLCNLWEGEACWRKDLPPLSPLPPCDWKGNQVASCSSQHAYFPHHGGLGSSGTVSRNKILKLFLVMIFCHGNRERTNPKEEEEERQQLGGRGHEGKGPGWSQPFSHLAPEQSLM